MRITAIITVTMGLAAAVHAAEKIRVYVDLNNAPSEVVLLAQDASARMFAVVGLGVEWRRYDPKAAMPDGRLIVVQFERGEVAGKHPGALAYALAYEGVHIVVFYDRIPSDITGSLVNRAAILAHVITHEITHVLQGIERHSASGIMKARWNSEEFRSMTFRALAFEPGDIDLIHLGLRRLQTTQVGPSVL